MVLREAYEERGVRVAEVIGMRMKKCVPLEFILWVGFLIAFFLLLSIPVHGATVQAHFNKTYKNANGTSTEIQLNNLINVSDASVTFTVSTVSGGGIFDNANGGTWKYYMSFPITKVTTEYAQYKIIINRNTWSIYNASGSLKATGTNDNFWSLVKSDGSDIRVFNQSSQLYFWIESWDYANQTAVIWVNLTAGSSELNIAYGNPSALTSIYNNPKQVFEVFDDFSANTIGTDWTEINAGWAWDPEEQYIKGTAGKALIEHSSFIDNGNFIYEFDFMHLSTSTYANWVWFMFKTTGTSGDYYSGDGYGVLFYLDSGGYARFAKSVAGSVTFTNIGPNTDTAQSANTWYHVKVIYNSGTIEIYLNDKLIFSTTDTDFNGGSIRFEENGVGAWHAIDNVRVSKLADPADFGTPSVKSFKCVNPTLNLNGNLVQYAGELNETNPCVTLSIDPSYFVNGINYANFTSDSGNFNAILSFDYALDIPESTTKTFEDMWVNASFYLPNGTVMSNTTFEFNTSYLGTPVYSYHLIVYVNGQQYSNYKVSDYEVNGVKYITVHVLDVPAGNVSIAIHTVFKQT